MAIIFHIECSIESGSEDVKIWRPDRLKQASVLLRDKIERVPDGGAVTLTAHPPATDPAAIKYVLEHLQDGFSEPHGQDYDIASLAAVCNVLVDFECDPEQFQGLWDRLIQKSSKHRMDERRCWRRKLDTAREAMTAKHLAISALVLGKEDELARELGVVVWGWKTKLDTTVPELQNLQAMRCEEQREIFEELKHQLLSLYTTGKVDFAEGIRERVKGSMLVELKDTWEENWTAYPELKTLSPYRLLQQFEEAFKLPDSAPATAPSKPPSKRPHQPGPKAPNIGLGVLGPKAVQGIKSIFKPKSTGDNGPMTIDGIFDAVEAKVQTRQRDRAKSLIRRRNADVAEWKCEISDPGSIRRPSPQGKGHRRGDSGLSLSRLPPPRPTNAHEPYDNGGEGSFRRREAGNLSERQQAPSSSSGPIGEEEGRRSNGKGRARPADPPSAIPWSQSRGNILSHAPPPRRKEIANLYKKTEASNAGQETSRKSESQRRYIKPPPSLSGHSQWARDDKGGSEAKGRARPAELSLGSTQHAKAGKNLASLQCAPGTAANGRGGSSMRGERLQPSSSSYGQCTDDEYRVSKGKARERPVEVSSVSTRHSEPGDPPSPLTPQRPPEAVNFGEGSSRRRNDANGVDGVRGVNGAGSFRIDFDYSDDNWRLGEP